MNDLNDDINKNFSGLNEKLNTTFDSVDDRKFAMNVIKELKTEVKEMDSKKNELASLINKPLLLMDQEFLRDQTKTLLMNCRVVLNRLESEIKIGSDSRIYEAYSKIIDSTTRLITELRMLNLDIVKVNKDNITPDKNLLNKKMKMSMSEVMEMIVNASNNNQTKKVDANFTIVDEKEEQ